MGSYAQQDAEECYSQIISTLRNVPGLTAGPDDTLVAGGAAGDPTATPGKKFVEQYLMGEMRRELSLIVLSL